MITLKVIKAGESLALLLSDEAASILKARDGGIAYMSVSPKGELRISGADLMAGEVALGTAFMDEYEDTFRNLSE